MKDENGIPQNFPVDDPTHKYVLSILSGRTAVGGAMNMPSATPAALTANPSFGSLPSASSGHGSQTSVSSIGSQGSAFSTTPGR